MYCVFHISDNLQRQILFLQILQKKFRFGQAPPPPGWDKIPSFAEKLIIAPLTQKAKVPKI